MIIFQKKCTHISTLFNIQQLMCILKLLKSIFRETHSILRLPKLFQYWKAIKKRTNPPQSISHSYFPSKNMFCTSQSGLRILSADRDKNGKFSKPNVNRRLNLFSNRDQILQKKIPQLLRRSLRLHCYDYPHRRWKQVRFLAFCFFLMFFISKFSSFSYQSLYRLMDFRVKTNLHVPVIDLKIRSFITCLLLHFIEAY